MNFVVPIDPYAQKETSEITSDLLDLRDAFRWTLSYRTSADTTSSLTLQLSNFSGSLMDTPPEASWVDHTNLTSGDTLLEGPAGSRYGRFLRTVNDTAQVLSISKHVR